MASRSSSPTYAHSRPLYEYPSPAQSDSVGLCSMSDSARSSTANDRWTGGSINTQDIPRSSQSTPNILPREYDPFAPFDNAAPSTYSHGTYPSTAGVEVSILPVSPALSASGSQRSSASGFYTNATATNPFTPRIKMEDPMDYEESHETMLMSSSEMSQGLMATSASYGGSLDAGYYHNQNSLGWPKMEYSDAQDLPSISSLETPKYDRHSGSHDASSITGHRRPTGTVPRTRQPRRLTTKEDANFQCPIKGCRKLFGRSYNFKAHMETHDAGREYPFPCPETDCGKKFVRKTDLTRHHQSVHMKERNHRCDYCGRFFARKDTLRRHMEDGCSKRFDIENLNLRPQVFDTQPRQLSYSSPAQYSPPRPPPPSSLPIHPRGSTVTSDTSHYFDQQEYLTGDHNQQTEWPH